MMFADELQNARALGWRRFFQIYKPLIEVRAPMFARDDLSEYFVRAARALPNWTVRRGDTFHGHALECWWVA